jgi:hypothetical protein
MGSWGWLRTWWDSHVRASGSHWVITFDETTSNTPRIIEATTLNRITAMVLVRVSSALGHDTFFSSTATSNARPLTLGFRYAPTATPAATR